MCTFLTAGRYCASWLQGEGAVCNVYTAVCHKATLFCCDKVKKKIR